MLLEMLLGANTPTGSQTFTSSGSFVVPNNTGYISAVVVGAGGGGGAGSLPYNGSGGAGGALVYANSIPVVPGETLTVTVGSGGASATSGGYSEISRSGTILMRANGGSGGSVGTSLLGVTTPATSANIGGYTYNQAGGNGGGAGYAFKGGASGGGGAGGYSGAGGTGGSSHYISFSSGAIFGGFVVYEMTVGGIYYFYTVGPYLYYTSDFSTFTRTHTASGTFYCVKKLDGGSILAGGTNSLLVYGGLFGWTTLSPGLGSAPVNNIADLYFQIGQVFLGSDNGVIVSNNSTILSTSSWTSGGIGGSQPLLCSTVIGLTPIFGGGNGTIAVRTSASPSPVGTFTAYSTGSSETVFGLANNGSTIVAVGGNGSIFTSTNTGATWTSRTSGTANTLTEVVWESPYFWAVGTNGTVLRGSSDGITWTAIPTTTTDTIRFVLPPSAITSNLNVLYGTGIFPGTGGGASLENWMNGYFDINSTGTNGSGGAGGGGGGSYTERGGGGGGVGILGTGTSGTGGAYAASNVGAGTGGSSGNTGTNGTGATTGGEGGNYGAGGAGGYSGAGAAGANGAVRIIWGRGKSFPSNAS